MGETPKLGFGIMRFPKKDGLLDYKKIAEVLDEYMQDEFCYFDLHPAYVFNKAQEILKKYVVEKYPRETFLIANKIPYYGINCYEDYEKVFLDELAACGVSYFDYYLLHALTRDTYEMHKRLGGFEFLKKIKEAGHVKHIGFSFHDTPELLEEILIQYPELEFVQLQINFYDWNSRIIRAKECYDVVQKYNKKIIVMEPIKGGSLAEIETGTGLSGSEVAKISLQFVAQLPGVDIILSGMTEKAHVKENRASLEKKDKIDICQYEKLRQVVDKQAKIQCTNCKYCMRECPEHILIPEILSLLNSYGRDKNLGGSRAVYKGLTYGKGKAGKCIGCRKCERACPQKVEIRKYMREAKDMFEGNKNYYSSEKNVQILLYLLKAHGIKKVITSPGATNIAFSYSVQQDAWFEVYSAPDERSAAYMACGLAEETGEPVALSCTGATASRNYIPGLTEAYYRKLPVLAITSAQPEDRIGHNIPQMVDRTNPLNDIAKLSVSLPVVNNAESEWAGNLAANKALLALVHRGGGPVHINLVTSFSNDFSVKELPSTRVIYRISEKEKIPKLPEGKIGVFCGAHSAWNKELLDAVERFCNIYNAVVIQDHTGNYTGVHGVSAALVMKQENLSTLNEFDLIIHLGNVSGAYFPIKAKQVWRVSPDGEICDTFRKLQYVFEMTEIAFFENIGGATRERKEEQFDSWNIECSRLQKVIPELPFSNLWIASQTAGKIPQGSVLHLGILNSLRSWSFYKMPQNVRVYSNTGGFGIDGCVSTLIGASLANPDKLYYGVVGDLAFFYDMNVLGNRHIGANVRLIVINNGCGTEFKNYNHSATILGDCVDVNIAAKGHYGKKSSELLKNYAENLGFAYYSATTKEEYLEVLPRIIDEKMAGKSMVVEVFTDSKEESEALKLISTLNGEKETPMSTVAKCAKPKRVQLEKKEVVMWGTGNAFNKNLSKVEQIYKVRFVCDNNSERWGKEVAPGVECISPERLKEMNDIFVVIMIENAKIGFNIANQLLDMGVTDFDLVHNWLEYA